MGKKKDKSSEKKSGKNNVGELKQTLATLAARVDDLSVQLDELARQPGPAGPAGAKGPAGPKGPAGATAS